MKRPLLLKLFILLACLMPSLSAAAAEAYACYTPSNTTLTFYYDNLRGTRTGTTYDTDNTGNSPGWATYSVVAGLKKWCLTRHFQVPDPPQPPIGSIK